MNVLSISYTEESSVLTEGKMLFSYVAEEGPTEEVLACNESENMHLNMCKTQSAYAFFEESVPGPSSKIN